MEKIKSKSRVKFASIYLVKEINLLTKKECYTPVIEFAKSKELQKIMTEFYCQHPEELAIELNLDDMDLDKLERENNTKNK